MVGEEPGAWQWAGPVWAVNGLAMGWQWAARSGLWALGTVSFFPSNLVLPVVARCCGAGGCGYPLVPVGVGGVGAQLGLEKASLI